MPPRSLTANHRAAVANACLDFGSHLLRIRSSSVTPHDAQDAVKSLFDWFASNNAFIESNSSIAVHSLSLGKELLEFRKTTTPQEAIDAIEDLYSSLSDES